MISFTLGFADNGSDEMDVDSDVNVPGNTRKPARRSQVKNDARILCRRGIVSSDRSIVM